MGRAMSEAGEVGATPKWVFTFGDGRADGVSMTLEHPGALFHSVTGVAGSCATQSVDITRCDLPPLPPGASTEVSFSIVPQILGDDRELSVSVRTTSPEVETRDNAGRRRFTVVEGFPIARYLGPDHVVELLVLEDRSGRLRPGARHALQEARSAGT